MDERITDIEDRILEMTQREDERDVIDKSISQSINLYQTN